MPICISRVNRADLVLGQEIPIYLSRASLEKAPYCSALHFHFSINGQGIDPVSKRALGSGQGISQKELHLYVVTYFVFTHVLFTSFTNHYIGLFTIFRCSRCMLQIVAPILSFDVWA